MYIVIKLPEPSTNSFTVGFPHPAPMFFNTKELLMNYLKTATGKMRIFEATELDYVVDVKLLDKEQIDNQAWNS